MQHVREGRVLCARQGASDERRSEQRGSKCALQSHAPEAKPAAQPTLPIAAGRRAAGARWARPEAHGLSDEAYRLSIPTASNFAGEDAKSLWPRPQQCRV